uniref:Uncharacterized protein n=1 Tax=Strombidium rassoulzadegani TaxID=1082188 RepID=A0A7S3FX62_9SPIT|mmetsp:Transcript_5979/g.10173  ORF Transcript_5979/g.10173 Transcript_5979/m.10173 type:complete len:111 (+) Transcript_5979:400-732(+)
MPKGLSFGNQGLQQKTEASHLSKPYYPFNNNEQADTSREQQSNVDALTMISKSENKFLMDANNETIQNFNSKPSTTLPANDTKMSDNEAFMAYMSKAEAGEEDEDDLEEQ